VNSKTVGERTEAIVLAELLKAGYVVLLPFGDNQRYDLVIEKDGSFHRVQCKTAHLARTGGAISFKTCSTYAHRGRPNRGYRGEADYFGVYSPDLKKVYLVPVEDVGESMASLRIETSRNGQTQGVRLAEQYEVRF
jgi:PD-(D/E)XK endonuclease